MIISRSTDCPYCGGGHGNSCYIVYDNGDYCFSCHNGSKQPANKYAYKQMKLANNSKAVFIPPHTSNTKEFSLEVLKWLNSYYIYDREIKLNNIMYVAPNSTEDEDSLLFPIKFDFNGQLMEFQRRFFPSKKFYSSPNLKKDVFITGEGQGSIVVLVEDFISAIRVGEFCSTMCMFGTKLSKLQLDILMQYDVIITWMDDDVPGQDAAKEINTEIDAAKLMYKLKYPYKASESWRVGNIKYKQPKELSPNEIKNIINSNVTNRSDL